MSFILDKYETSITWESFYGHKATAKKEDYINKLLEWRFHLMENKKKLDDETKIWTIDYEIEATDKLLDIANNIF